MRKIILFFLLFTIIAKDIPFAQEVGHLAMEVELLTTVGGTFAGVGAGFLVWLMDPGQPTPLATHLHGGAAFGTFMGMLGGVFLLTKTAVVPGYVTLPHSKMNQVSSSPNSFSYAPESYWDHHFTSNSQQKSLSFSLLHYRF